MEEKLFDKKINLLFYQKVIFHNNNMFSDDPLSEKKIQKYIEDKKEFYDYLMTFIENSDDNEEDFQNLIKIINTQQQQADQESFEKFLQLLASLANNHHHGNNLYQKILRIIKKYRAQIKQTFSNIEIFDIFKDNKLFLLFLFEKEIITIDEEVKNELLFKIELNGNRFCHFFYPELKKFINDERIKEIESELLSIDSRIFDHFDKKRHEGENDAFICSLIREDSIKEFVQHVNQAHISLNSDINNSLFETNQFLLENTPTLIEYSAFFGSIKIFNYLKMNNVELEPSLWLYAIHSRNAELIHLLESCNVSKPNNELDECIAESIKCHHNEITDYFENEDPKKNEKVISSILHYQNYHNFPTCFEEGNDFFYLYNYKYHTLVNLYIEMHKEFIKIVTDGVALSNRVQFAADENIIEIIYCLLLKEGSIKHNINFRKMTKIAIPMNIISIEKKAFNECSKLQQIIIPSNVVYINDYAFYSCRSLQQIMIPSSVKIIGSYAFYGCESLKQVTFGTNSNLLKVGRNAFENCSSLCQIHLPPSVSSIGQQAFKRCILLKDVTLPSSLMVIRDDIFDISSIQEIKVPSSVKKINKYAFRKISTLKKVTFQSPSLFVRFLSFLFYECTSLTEITIPPSVKSIGNNTFFRCKAIERIEIPSSVMSIGQEAFFECESLKEVIIHSALKQINALTFFRCHSLKYINIPNSVLIIYHDAFNQCFSLEQISFPKSLTKIEHDAFAFCHSLSKISIPSSINCDNLGLDMNSNIEITKI